MLKSSTLRPSEKKPAGCQVTWLGTFKSRNCNPVPSAFISAILPFDTKKNRAGTEVCPPNPAPDRQDVAATIGDTVVAIKNWRRLNLFGSRNILGEAILGAMPVAGKCETNLRVLLSSFLHPAMAKRTGLNQRPTIKLIFS